MVLRWEHLQHSVQVARQQILPTNLEHAREMIDLLKAAHVSAKVYSNQRIRPAHVPVLVLTDQLVPESSADARYNVITAIEDANTDWRSGTSKSVGVSTEQGHGGLATTKNNCGEMNNASTSVDRFSKNQLSLKVSHCRLVCN